MMSRCHCLLTNEFTLWDLIAARTCGKIFFPGCFKIQFVCDKVIKLCVQYVVIFLLVLFTVFEVYSYLLRQSFVNRELLANLVYLYIMNTIIIVVARDS